ncbi:hypothetical protein H4S07_006222 [Coemansia furcata]|uniref:Uncharacterized protein n=1 Tax=Coemansia furcata TaxID=417177 RepID=A0ACC1KX94_9FUNG|nr:hypothetical protein H4S07_006222 [Coemansia furcata]
MGGDNTNNNNNTGEGSRGIQTEQSFEALLLSASHNQTPEDYERAQLAMEKKREAHTAKWAARLIGKTLVDAEPAPVFAPSENVKEDDRHNAESDNNNDNDNDVAAKIEAAAGDNGYGDEHTKPGDVAEEEEGSDDIAEDNITSTTGADVDKDSVVDIIGGDDEAEEECDSTGDSTSDSTGDSTGDDDKAEVDSGSDFDGCSDDEVEVDSGSDWDGGSDDHFFSLASLPTNRRILYGPNAPMTMDYRPDRLNVVLDKNGVCTEVFFV